MRKRGILNKQLQTAISDMGHTDIMIIADAGLPVARPEQRVDLALCEEVPTIAQVLKLVLDEMICETILVASEQAQFNPRHHGTIRHLAGTCPVELIAHQEILDTYLAKAKYIVRTGSMEPWGNVVLVGGIDAHKWFAREGCITPDYYAERAARKIQ